jgi:hypothetical protein
VWPQQQYATGTWWTGTASPNVTIFPNTIIAAGTTYMSPPAPTDWERAAVKAEPDDEFTWLRRRVREVEELAFA